MTEPNGDNDGDPDGTEGSPVAADVYALLADETRVEILGVLHEVPMEPPVSFSTLYDHVEASDTAQFNYHLKQLTPQFVTKREAGYELSAAGRRLARAVTAGIYTEIPRIEPFDLEGHCYACGAAALRGAYEDEQFTIDCTACGELVLGVRVPPTLARGRTPAAFVTAFEEWSRMQTAQASRGLCPDCGGAVDASVTDDVHETITFEAVVAYDCTVCGRRAMTSFGSVASFHPEVQQFHEARGTSIRDRPYWEVDQFVTGDHVDVLSRDPWRVRVSFFADGDACHVELDGAANVVDVDVDFDVGVDVVSDEEPP